MADPKITDAKTSGLDTIAGEAKRAGHKGPPPVHLWNPPFCGDLDMRIAADGTWFYLKTPIGRRDLWALVTRALFYDLVELGEERDIDGKRMFGVASGGEFYLMAEADSLKGLR